MEFIRTTARLALIVVTVFAISGLVLAAESKPSAPDKKITQKELPTAVIASFQRNFPNAAITQVAMDTKDGVNFYDVECKEGSIQRDLLFTSDGTLKEIGEHISAKDLPAVVASAIAAAYPSGLIKEAEMKTLDGIRNYEVAVASNNKIYELMISPGGTVLATEEEADDDDKGEDD